MSDIAFRAENLSKLYRIGARQDGYKTLREQIAHGFTSLFSHNGHEPRANSKLEVRNPKSETLRALDDVSFEIKRGEVVGIVGRNGAGKSTLLKIISRITEPTEGYVEIHGRVGSLLEVGTGFHPELTGRENTYLSGAILGMKQREIGQKFDEIVSFAEVEKFVDTPIKHYSSGMYMRLAFAVAAHLEPEILLIDEVLAVGDALFQKKCLGKMGAVAREGRTVLFVSHNMPAVSHLCGRAIWLDGGRMKEIGQAKHIISHYIRFGQKESTVDLAIRTDRTGSGALRFVKFSLCDGEGVPIDSVASGKEVVFAVHYETPQNQPLKSVIVSVAVSDANDYRLFTLSTHLSEVDFNHLPPRGVLWCRVPAIPLVAGIYSIYLWCSIGREHADEVTHAAEFNVVEADVYNSGKTPVGRKHGALIVPHSWSCSEESRCANGLTAPV
jgi:lipopolysaccharide transport system ATP-binding protein